VADVSSPRFAHVYRETTLVTSTGEDLTIVGTTATSMGLTAAAIVTTQLILQFRPRIVVMIGIAAGTHEGGKQFGDVLVADPSVDYNSGKLEEVDGVREFLPDPYPIGLNPRVRSVLQKYRGQHAIFDEIRAGWKGEAPSKANRLHLGPVGAADQVIDDPRRVIEIQRNWRKLIGWKWRHMAFTVHVTKRQNRNRGSSPSNRSAISPRTRAIHGRHMRRIPLPSLRFDFLELNGRHCGQRCEKRGLTR